MRYTLRAMAAIALLIGVYVLGLAVVATLGFATYEVAANTGGGYLTGKLGVVTLVVAVALLGALWSTLRPVPDRPDGVMLTEHEEPRLWAEVRELADKVGTRAPDEIRVVPQVNAAVSERTRWLGLVTGTRRLYIGIPLLQTFTHAQLRFVLAHELGHYGGRHTALGPIVYRGQVALTAVISRIGQESLVAGLFKAYYRLYLAVSGAVSRRQEVEADVIGAQLAGSTDAASALRELRVVASAWQYFLDEYATQGTSRGRRPERLFEGFRLLWTDPGRQEQIETARAAEPDRQSSPYESHPSPALRIAGLEVLDFEGPPGGSEPAMSVLDDAQRACSRLEDWMFRDSDLKPVAWDSLAADAVAEYAHRSCATLMKTASTLGETLRYVREGRARELTAALLPRDAGDSEVREAASALVGQAVQSALIDRHDASFELNWGGPWRLVDKTGAPLDVWPLVERAFADRRETDALIEFVENEGLADHSRKSDSLPPEPEASEPMLGLLFCTSWVRPRILVATTRGLLVVPRGFWHSTRFFDLGLGGKPLKILLEAADEGLATLQTNPRSVSMPWESITRVRITRWREGIRINTVEGTVRLTAVHAHRALGEPMAAMRHFLGERFAA